jgi:hypothetical protein
MTHSMGLVLPFSTRECPQRNQRWKRMEDYGCRIWQRRGPGKRWREQEEEVLSGKLSQITRSARVLQSPSCLGDGRLEGLSMWRREETSMGAGGWPKSHHSADCGPLESQWLLPCPDHAISSHDWTTDERCRRRGWLHPGPSHAPKGA